MQPGEPYVGVEAKCESGNTTLALSQKRYFNTPEAFNAPNDQLWQIPVCVKGVGGRRRQQQCFLLTERQQQFTHEGLLEVRLSQCGALGYYRFDYDTGALHQLGSSSGRGADS